MPDPDGIAAFPDGVWHCHHCRRWLHHQHETDRRQRKPESANDAAKLEASFGEPPIRVGGETAYRKRRRAGAHRST